MSSAALVPSSYAAVLADVDRTLIDTGPVEAWGWSAWAALHDLDPAPFIAGHGMRADEKLALYAPRLNPATEIARLVEIVATCPIAPAALPGAMRLLATTPTLALVTSGARALILRQLRRAALTPPEVIIAAEDVARGKPDPEPFLSAAERLRVDPVRCLVLEDAVAGVASGVAAGMIVVAVLGSTPAAELRDAGARLVVPNVAEYLRLRDGGMLPHR